MLHMPVVVPVADCMTAHSVYLPEHEHAYLRYCTQAQWAGLDVPTTMLLDLDAHGCDEGVSWGFGSTWCSGRTQTSLQLLSGLSQILGS